jgi:hypothetical protein
MNEWGEIRSVADVIKKLDSARFKRFRTSVVPDYRRATDYKYPFGIWFRGHSDAKWRLTPGILREQNRRVRKVYTEETSMFHHFQLRVSEHRHTYQNTFEWLCLMQHYDMPTRLLDWTESVLVALFFAVEGSRNAKKDGRLYLLNARRLNEHTTHYDRQYKANICTPTSVDTASRSQLATSRNLTSWKENMLSLTEKDNKDLEKTRKIIEEINEHKARFRSWLASPIAVFPSRLNGRMILQSSMFTLHGGKLFRDKEPILGEDLPEPQSLETINEGLRLGDQFLGAYRIRSSHKGSILKELLTLGVHFGSLFPELDKQAAYVKEQWRFETGPEECRLASGLRANSINKET